VNSLTDRQREVLDVITAHRAQHGFSPTTREIQRHFGFSSQAAVMSHMRALRQKGSLTWSPGQSRTAIPVPPPVDPEPVEAAPQATAPSFFMVAYEGDDGLSWTYAMDPKCEGGLTMQIGTSLPVALFASREQALRAIDISVEFAKQEAAQGKSVDPAFIEHRQDINVLLAKLSTGAGGDR
jgi:hypothetical protein